MRKNITDYKPTPPAPSEYTHHNCEICGSLKIINEGVVYAVCVKKGKCFKLWDEDTRTSKCEFFKRREND